MPSYVWRHASALFDFRVLALEVHTSSYLEAVAVCRFI